MLSEISGIRNSFQTRHSIFWRKISSDFKILYKKRQKFLKYFKIVWTSIKRQIQQKFFLASNLHRKELFFSYWAGMTLKADCQKVFHQKPRWIGIIVGTGIRQDLFRKTGGKSILDRVLVIGCSGSGKSVFARRLAAITCLPLYYLDMIWHRADWTTAIYREADKNQGLIVKWQFVFPFIWQGEIMTGHWNL